MPQESKGDGTLGGIVAGAMVFGFVTLFFGLVIMFPLIGHATWHAFRDLVARGDGS